MSEWTCFVLMPFADEFQDVFLLIRDLPSFEGQPKLALYRADDIAEPGRITDQVLEAISQCDFVIADVSGGNANVMFELGYARALGKPAILLNQDVGDSPFDIADLRQVVYDRTRLVGDLKPQLISAVQAVLARLLQSPDAAPRGDEQVGVDETQNEAARARAQEQAAQLTQGALSLQDAIVRLEAIEMEIDLCSDLGDKGQLQRLTKDLKEIVDKVDVSNEAPDALLSLSSELGDLAVSLHNASLHREAEDVFNRAMSLGVQHAGVHVQYALFMALHKRDYDKASTLLERAEHLGADNERLARARVQIAGSKALLGTGSQVDDTLVADVRRMHEEDPESWDVLASYLVLLRQSKEYDEIDRLCKGRLETLGNDPSNEDVYRVMRSWADALAGAREPELAEKAASMYRSILEARENDADVLSNLATLTMVYASSSDEKKAALGYYGRAYKIRPDDNTIRRAFSRATADVTGRKDLALRILKGELLETDLEALL